MRTSTRFEICLECFFENSNPCSSKTDLGECVDLGIESFLQKDGPVVLPRVVEGGEGEEVGHHEPESEEGTQERVRIHTQKNGENAHTKGETKSENAHGWRP